MLVEIDKNIFRRHFYKDPHPFISIPFIELNRHKIDKIVYLIEDKKKKNSIGLIAGIKNKSLISPFSAPFGGFHFRNESIYVKEIENFINLLKSYISSNKLNTFKISLPPNFYHPSFNTKVINTLIRTDFLMETPDITSCVDLSKFKGIFSNIDSRTHYNQAVRKKLSFNLVTNFSEKEAVYDLIYLNRKRYNRPIYMTLDDILKTSELWETDFFQVKDMSNNLIASAIFYRSHPNVSYAVFWADNELGRPLKSMDFLSYKLWEFYKNLGFDYIDLGISTESGIPNEGLLRFKETHEGISSLRYTFKYGY